MSIDAILERIGHSGPFRPDVETLRALHAAWRRTVPYENIDIQLGRDIRLEPSALIAKFGPDRRGGTCYQLNGALALLLRGAGFRVTVHEAAVRRRSGGETEWGGHIALLVHLDAGTWLADVGIADGFVEPLPLREGVHHQGPLTYRLERVDATTWRWYHHERGSIRSYDLRTAPRRLADFTRRATTRAAGSLMERLLIAYRLWDERSVTLLARTVTVATLDGTHVERRVLGDRDSFAAALADDIGVPLADLGPEGIDTLWSRTTHQHAEWLARQEA
ncbi:arylamine N-acetyltransferase [Streptosporangium sp. NPDC023825]|uniref:arylamine N-acetyltransferase family protein n=1 Tax=Streptosporangium sp. NPDC023825 TaxID=3154909 RepID=UPI003415EBE9